MLWGRAVEFHTMHGRWPNKAEDNEAALLIIAVFKAGKGHSTHREFPPSVMIEARRMGVFKGSKPPISRDKKK